MSDLSSFELEVLRCLDGRASALPYWGAAQGAALDVLIARGLVSSSYKITAKGEELLKELEAGNV